MEQEGIRRSHEKIDQADLVVAVMDGSAPADHRDRQALEACSGKETIKVLNKKDLGLVMQSGVAEIGSANRTCIVLSAKTGEGLDQFESLLADTGKAMAGEKDSSNQASLNSRCLLLMQTAQLAMTNLMESSTGPCGRPRDYFSRIEASSCAYGRNDGRTCRGRNTGSYLREVLCRKIDQGHAELEDGRTSSRTGILPVPRQ